MENAIILFTRAPIPGKTKTRMEALLTKEEAAILHEAMIQDMYHMIKNIPCDIFIYFTPAEGACCLKRVLGPDELYMVQQQGDDLGGKMKNAVEDVLLLGYEKCLLLGTDIPEVKSEDLNEAFFILETNDVVFGPTKDKGYYLVGMKTMHSSIFVNQIYGEGNVLEQAIKGLDQVGFVQTYSDLDDPKDLYNFLKEQNGGQTPKSRGLTLAYVEHLRKVYKKQWNNLKD